MKPTRTWILIADAGRARVLANNGPGKGVAEVEGHTSNADLPRTHEIVSDRQPRGHESASPSRHAIEPRTDPREQLKEAHLAAIAERIDRALGEDAFDRLVVVAPPTALGMLRQAFTARVTKAVTAEVAKDLTKTPDADIAGHLADVIRL